MKKEIVFKIETQDFSQKRLDVVLFELLKKEEEGLQKKDFFSRSKIQSLIKAGQVLVNGKHQKGSYLLNISDVIECHFEDLGIQDEIKPWNVDINIVYEDDDVLVVDKDASFVVHPGAGNKEQTLLNAIINHLSFSKNQIESSNEYQRVGIVHRIDKDTTGLLVIAKNEFAQTNLMEQFKNHTVDRMYIGLALTTPRQDREINKSSEGRIETMIGRHDVYRKKMAVLEEKGKLAITNWKKLEDMKYACLLSFKLETGRTHQIRVHMDYVNSPLIGDKLYGDFSLLPKKLKVLADKFGRQALHAKSLSFTHPVTKERLSFSSDIPDDMKNLIEEFRKF